MRAIPTVDRSLLGRPARRTALVAAALGAAALLAAAAAAQAARGLEARQSGFLSRDASTIVVLDLSLSIPPVVYRRMHALFERLSRSDGDVGLVIFSDSAYELLPPGTPARELRPLLRFLAPTERPEGVFRDDRPYYLPDPWTETFRSGTKISEGINLARELAERDGIRASVLLVSDLHSAEPDREPLVQALQRLIGAEIPLRIVPLSPLDDNRRLFRDLAGPDAFADWRELLPRDRPARVETVQTAAASPLALVLAAATLLVLLALNELWCRRIELPRSAG